MPTPAREATNASQIKTLSTVLTEAAAGAPERCMVAGRCCVGAGAAEAGGLEMLAPGAAVLGGGTGAAGAEDIGGALGAPDGPAGGKVGSLMVGAAVGFGGKLMRTVSFLGCTLPVSFLGGGTAPVGPGGGGVG